jgi:hypothetical protein
MTTSHADWVVFGYSDIWKQAAHCTRPSRPRRPRISNSLGLNGPTGARGSRRNATRISPAVGKAGGPRAVAQHQD